MLPHFQHIIDETEVAHGLAQNFRLLNKCSPSAPMSQI
jgi:hypothetical protein